MIINIVDIIIISKHGCLTDLKRRSQFVICAHWMMDTVFTLKLKKASLTAKWKTDKTFKANTQCVHVTRVPISNCSRCMKSIIGSNTHLYFVNLQRQLEWQK